MTASVIVPLAFSALVVNPFWFASVSATVYVSPTGNPLAVLEAALTNEKLATPLMKCISP